MAVYEVAIAARDFGPGRAKEGDIIEVRKPLGYIGTGEFEQSSVLWLVIDTDEDPENLKLKSRRLRQEEPENIPLQTLNDKGLSFDLMRVRDQKDRYQPGLDPHPETGHFRKMPTPVQLRNFLPSRELAEGGERIR